MKKGNRAGSAPLNRAATKSTYCSSTRAIRFLTMAHASSVLCGVLVMIVVQSEPDSSSKSHRCSGSEASSGSLVTRRASSARSIRAATVHGKRSGRIVIGHDAPSPTPSYSMRSCARTFRPDTQRRRPRATTAPATRPPLSVKVLTHRVHYWLLRARALRTSVHPLWVLSRPSVAQGDTSVFHQQKTRHHTKQREKYQFLQSRRYSRRTADVQFLNPPFRLAPISARSRGIAALTDLQSVQHQRLY